MKISRALALLSFLAPALTFWRMECRGRVAVARIDPLMSPGTIAQHAHSIHGSPAFSEDVTYEQLMAANCTSCKAAEDKSVYWHPSLYFMHDDGRVELVNQVGGMLAYYLLTPDRGNEAAGVRAFPKDFRMIAGDSSRRNFSIKGYSAHDADPEKSFWAALGQTSQDDLSQRALGFNCLNYGKTPEGSLYRHYLPDKAYMDANCLNGTRLEIMFPSCWDGKSDDSADHKSHVAYPDLVNDGACPKGYPVKLPGLFYETIWDTYSLKDCPGKFVLSNGDPTGFGYHADFIMGWDEKLLQQAVDTCTAEDGKIESCPLFTIVSEESMNQCKMDMPAAIAKERYTGIVGNALPGDVAIQYGPEPALHPHPSAVQPPTSVSVPYVSYSPGSSASGGNFQPGQIFVATSPTGEAMVQETGAPVAPAPEAPAPAPAAPAPEPPVAPVPNPPIAAGMAAPTPSNNTPTLPATTPAPEKQPHDDLSYKPTCTEWVTEGHVVTEVVYEEAVVWVTETQTVTVEPKVRRQLHAHAHAHQRRQAHHHRK